MRLIAILLVLLTGCQTTRTADVTKSTPDQYQAVIEGGLGIKFNSPLSKLIEMGFEKNTRPRKQYEVGEWKIPFYKATGFFNFGREVLASPSTGQIYSIKGFRFYPAKRHLDHFRVCTDDYTLLRTKIKAKYASLHSRYEPSLNVSGKHSTVAFSEGKGSYKHLSSPRYFGRSIELTCSIQTRGDQVIGSMLFVTYSEDYEATKALRAEQKEIFEKQSGTRLKEKGIDEKDL